MSEAARAWEERQRALHADHQALIAREPRITSREAAFELGITVSSLYRLKQYAARGFASRRHLCGRRKAVTQ